RIGLLGENAAPEDHDLLFQCSAMRSSSSSRPSTSPCLSCDLAPSNALSRPDWGGPAAGSVRGGGAGKGALKPVSINTCHAPSSLRQATPPASSFSAEVRVNCRHQTFSSVANVK